MSHELMSDGQNEGSNLKKNKTCTLSTLECPRAAWDERLEGDRLLLVWCEREGYGQ